MKNSKNLKMALLVVAVLAIWGYVRSINKAASIPANNSTPRPAPTASILSEHDEAQEHAKNFILKALKAPATAKFPPYSEIKTKKVNGIWEVETYVDAQNGFGAMLRAPYFLKMENQGAVWKLVYIGNEREPDYKPTPVNQTTAIPQGGNKPAKPEIYRSVDKDGNPVFSDTPR